MGSTKRRGFTLVELMIAMAVVAILSALAIPSYTQHVIRANRLAAQAQMLHMASIDQQFLLANRAYLTESDALWTSVYSLPADLAARYNYTITTGTDTVPYFLIAFTPTGAQSDDGVLTLDSEGGKTPIDKW